MMFVAGLFPMSSSGVSLPMMLNGLLAYSQPQGPHPQQQLGPSLPILGLQQPQQHCEGDAATPMMIDGGTSASAPEGEACMLSCDAFSTPAYVRNCTESHARCGIISTAAVAR